MRTPFFCCLAPKLSDEDIFNFANAEWTDKEFNSMTTDNEVADVIDNCDICASNNAANSEENQNNSSFKRPSKTNLYSPKEMNHRQKKLKLIASQTRFFGGYVKTFRKTKMSSTVAFHHKRLENILLMRKVKVVS